MSNKQIALSRIVGVEEHVVFSELTRRLPEEAVIARGYLSRDQPYGKWSLSEKMEDTEDRIQVLNAARLTLQVLSYPSAGADLFPPRDGLQWAKDLNDRIASRIGAHPSRYAGLAHLTLD